jgi:very-short-patch-repair endonuclease
MTGNSTIDTVLTIGIALFVIVTVLRILGYPKQKQAVNPKNVNYSIYKKKSSVLTGAELSFYKTLAASVGNRATIFSKVGLKDIFEVNRGSNDDEQANKQYRRHFNMIAQKHVDFLVCDRITLAPLIAIELDDKSHDSEKVKKRDEFVNSLYHAANLPLLRFKVSGNHYVDDVKKVIDQYLPE